MLRPGICQGVFGPLVLFSALLEPCAAGRADADEYKETIARVLRLLPRQPDKVVVVDAESGTLPLRDTPQRVEAFVTHGQRVVYLVRQGVTLQRALKGPGIFDYALAIVIWHEMAHIEGADEPKARREEEDLWRQFVVARRVDSAIGLNYLALLRKRR